MQAMTVQQPWAWAISIGAKTVENRSRNVWQLGEVAIHAGRRWSNRGAHDERVVRAALAGVTVTGYKADEIESTALARLVRTGLTRGAYPTGAVTAIAELLEAHPDAGCCRPWGESLYPEGGGRIRTDVQHLTLGNVRRLEHPVPAAGALGRWQLPADVERAVLDQLATTTTGDPA